MSDSAIMFSDLHLWLVFFLLRKHLRLHSIRRLSIIENAHVYFCESRWLHRAEKTLDILQNIHIIRCTQLSLRRLCLAWYGGCVYKCVCMCVWRHIFIYWVIRDYKISFVRKYNFIFLYTFVRVTVTLHYKEPSNWENGS